MSHNNLVSTQTRYFSANATLSNICVTELGDPSIQNLSSKLNLSNSSPTGNHIQPQQVKQDMKKNTESTEQPLLVLR